MKKTRGFVAVAVLAMTLSGASVFADSRPPNETWRDQRGDRNGRSDDRFEDRRITAEGRIRNVTAHVDGYRVQLDRGNQWYHVPSSYVRSRGRGLSVGISIRLGGVMRGDYVYVDDLDWMDQRYDDRYGRGDRNDDLLRGRVERVDYRNARMWIRTQNDVIRVDMRDTRRHSRIDLSDLRRGDLVTLSGDWSRRGIFDAFRIESVRSGRY